MGHHVSGIVLRGRFDGERAAEFDLTPIPLRGGLTLFPLDAGYTDYWAEKLDEPGDVAEIPLLNALVVHRIARAVAPDAPFALIETDYFGGTGSQAAAVYQGNQTLMSPVCSEIGPVHKSKGPINQALGMLGLKGQWGRDAFETAGLHQYRDFYDLFEKYRPEHERQSYQADK